MYTVDMIIWRNKYVTLKIKNKNFFLFLFKKKKIKFLFIFYLNKTFQPIFIQ